MPTLLKPSWVTHGGNAIYSVHIHPDGTRFATGGGEGQVKVWSLAPVLREQEASSSKRLLCSISGHTGSVNVVRWSPDGRFLATASGDETVGIAENRFDGGKSGFGTTGPSENWRFKQLLRGHKLDVCDLAWSPDSTKLASCGHDRQIIIWDVSHEGKQIASLKGHTTMVKGVAWDPMGRYIASQDDSCMIIWRVDGWKKETVITAPFSRATERAIFKRPSWSADGGLLLAAAGTKQKHFVAPLVKRETWEIPQELVGHKAAVSVTAFNPVVFTSPQGPLFCCAIAGLDNVVSLWLTSRQRSFIAIKHLFEKPITDAQWSQDGDVLLMSSLEGDVAALIFEPKEIGRKLTEQEKEEHIRKQYGDSLTTASGAFFEDPALLSLYQQQASKAAADKTPKTATPAVQQTEMQTQVETNVGGKRRIRPVLLQPVEEPSNHSSSDTFNVFAVGNFAIPGSSSSNPPPTTSTTTATTTPSTISSTSTATATAANKPSSSQESDFYGISAAPISEKKRARPEDESEETPTKKKSTEPAATPTMSSAAPVSRPAAPVNTSQPSQTTPAPGAPASDLVAPEKPVSKLSAAGAKKVGAKRGRKPKRLLEDGSDGGEVEEVVVDRATAPRLLLPVPDVGKRFVKEIAVPTVGFQSFGDASNVLFEVSVDLDETGIRPTKSSFVVSSNQVILWKDHIEDRALVVTGSPSHFYAVGCSSGDIYIFSPNGRRCFPAITLSSFPIVALECCQGFLLAVSSDGLLRVWNVDIGMATVDINLHSFMARNANSLASGTQPPSVLPYLNAPSVNPANIAAPIGEERDENVDGIVLRDFVHKFEVAENGQPLLILTSGMVYGYSTMMASWACVYDINWQRQMDKSGTVTGPLNTLQRNALRLRTQPSSYSSFLSLSIEDRHIRNIAHIETQISSAELLGSVEEYKQWMKLYVRELSSAHHEKKLTELCQSLLGPIRQNPNSALPVTWDPFVLGISKRSLLEELLPIMVTKPDLQRLVANLRESLSFAKETEAQDLVILSQSNLPIGTENSMEGSVGGSSDVMELDSPSTPSSFKVPQNSRNKSKPTAKTTAISKRNK